MMREDTTSPISARTLGILLMVAILSLGAIIVLVGWAPELRNRNVAGPHPYSTSAIGYNGAVELLTQQGIPVDLSRLERNLTDRYDGLMIATLTDWGMLEKLENTDFAYNTLLVLPKWRGATDPVNPKWQRDTTFISARRINDLLETLDIDAELGRVAVPDTVSGPYGKLPVRPDMKLQVLYSDYLDPVISTDDGILLGQIPGETVYILTDPDMMNTFGLSQIENARFLLHLIDYFQLDYDYEQVHFDVTLHGFARTENLLQMMFDVPFLGATLIALASAGLLGWGALIRFGPPDREGRAIALGKQALVDNSAGLVTMARRETRMAAGYLHMIKRRTARDIGAPGSLTDEQLTKLFDRLGPEERTQCRFSDLAADLSSPIASRHDLLQNIRNLYRWRQQVLRRTTYERK